MLRVALLLILFVVLGRTFWRVIDGLVEGITGRTRAGVPQQGVPQQGVPMVRDPVCGTFVLPERAVSLSDGRTRLFFCSDACRDKYRARSA
jgi:YHS domain-containing protein